MLYEDGCCWRKSSFSKNPTRTVLICLLVLILIVATIGLVFAQKKQTPTELDIKVKKFLNENRQNEDLWLSASRCAANLHKR